VARAPPPATADRYVRTSGPGIWKPSAISAGWLRRGRGRPCHTNSPRKSQIGPSPT